MRVTYATRRSSVGSVGSGVGSVFQSAGRGMDEGARWRVRGDGFWSLVPPGSEKQKVNVTTRL